LGNDTVSGSIQCPYHGREINTGGDCLHMPSCHHMSGVGEDALS